jgi:hypothetical protein
MRQRQFVAPRRRDTVPLADSAMSIAFFLPCRFSDHWKDAAGSRQPIIAIGQSTLVLAVGRQVRRQGGCRPSPSRSTNFIAIMIITTIIRVTIVITIMITIAIVIGFMIVTIAMVITGIASVRCTLKCRNVSVRPGRLPFKFDFE